MGGELVKGHQGLVMCQEWLCSSVACAHSEVYTVPFSYYTLLLP